MVVNRSAFWATVFHSDVIVTLDGQVHPLDTALICGIDVALKVEQSMPGGAA